MASIPRRSRRSAAGGKAGSPPPPKHPTEARRSGGGEVQSPLRIRGRGAAATVAAEARHLSRIAGRGPGIFTATALAAAATATSSAATPSVAAASALVTSPYFALSTLTPKRHPAGDSSLASSTSSTPKRFRLSSSSSSSSSTVTAARSAKAYDRSSSASKIFDAVKEKAKGSSPPRTTSFQPVWAGSLASFGWAPLSEEEGANVKLHTLILGTHPSIASLEAAQYYGHPMNAFWWISGDCLGFRRASGVSSTGEPYKFTVHLRHGQAKILPYDQQVRLLASRGFALWDVLESCERKGSLDAAIKNERPNAIREFCASHPTVRRIVLANGGTGCSMFRKHFETWWRSGELLPEANKQSLQAFKKYRKVTDNFRDGKIRCVSALSVSPAAATYSYVDKRDFWEEFVFKPGLEDHEELKRQGS